MSAATKTENQVDENPLATGWLNCKKLLFERSLVHYSNALCSSYPHEAAFYARLVCSSLPVCGGMADFRAYAW